MEPLQYRRPRRLADLEAHIAYLPTDGGGRSAGVCSGYRAIHDFGLTGELHDAQHEYPERRWVDPGTDAIALLWLLAPEAQRGRFYSGMKFTVQDGAKVVGHGEVMTVLNKELARDA
jgi:translation elongation factor EF-Tu-like GTPase